MTPLTHRLHAHFLQGSVELEGGAVAVDIGVLDCDTTADRILVSQRMICFLVASLA